MAASTSKNSELPLPGKPLSPAESEFYKKLVDTLYGLKMKSIRSLNGYDDSNYHIIVGEYTSNIYMPKVCKDGYILKIINSSDSEEPEFFEAQSKLLLHLDQNNIRCSKPILTLKGKFFVDYFFSSGKQLVRLLEYISGTILNDIACTNKLCYEIGEYTAKMDVALETFKHPVYNTHESIWMLESVADLQEFLCVTKLDETKKALAGKVIDEFTSKVLSVQDTFKKGIIHGDINEQNIIVEKNKRGEWAVKAFIDFGDSQFSCYLYELAIAMTYVILQTRNLDVGGHILAGYSSVKKLPEEELKLLKICIAARLTQSLVMGAYTIIKNPENKYVLTTSECGWAVLEEIWQYTNESLLSRFQLIACETEYKP